MTLFYPLDTYRQAPSGEGELAYRWKDKPHRLVYELVAEVERLRKIEAAAREVINTDDHGRLAIDVEQTLYTVDRLRDALGEE